MTMTNKLVNVEHMAKMERIKHYNNYNTMIRKWSGKMDHFVGNYFGAYFD